MTTARAGHATSASSRGPMVIEYANSEPRSSPGRPRAPSALPKHQRGENVAFRSSIGHAAPVLPTGELHTVLNTHSFLLTPLNLLHTLSSGVVVCRIGGAAAWPLLFLHRRAIPFVLLFFAIVHLRVGLNRAEQTGFAASSPRRRAVVPWYAATLWCRRRRPFSVPSAQSAVLAVRAAPRPGSGALLGAGAQFLAVPSARWCASAPTRGCHAWHRWPPRPTRQRPCWRLTQTATTVSGGVDVVPAIHAPRRFQTLRHMAIPSFLYTPQDGTSQAPSRGVAI